MSTANSWEQIQLFCRQQSLDLKAENQELKNVKDYQVPEAVGPPDLLSGHLLTTCVDGPAQVEDGCVSSEAHSVKSQKINPSGRSDTTDAQICEFKDGGQRLPEEEKIKSFSVKIRRKMSNLKISSTPAFRTFKRICFR